MRFARLIFFLFCLARGTGRDVIVSRDGGCGCARCTIYVFKSLAMRLEYFLSHSRRRARGCRARVPSRAPRSRPARAEKIQGTRAKLSNRLFIVFTHAPPRARTRIRPYPRGCSPRTRGSSSQRSFSPSLRRGGDTRRGRRCLCPPPKFKTRPKATVLFFFVA